MAATIHTFESRFGVRTLLEHTIRHPSSTGANDLPSGDVALGPAVLAHVNHGRWIADCPTAGCGGAELVSFDNPVFFCCECRNAAVEHNLLPVLIPGTRERKQVERHLTARPEPATRNWHPAESIVGLRGENRANGVRS